jgi:hypothetical protein
MPAIMLSMRVSVGDRRHPIGLRRKSSNGGSRAGGRDFGSGAGGTRKGGETVARAI